MSYVANLFIIACAFFALTTVSVATFHALPKGKLQHKTVIRSVRFINFHWTSYWLLPILLLLFVSTIGGFGMLLASIVGLTFKKRYNKVIAAQAVTPPPIPAAA